MHELLTPKETAEYLRVSLVSVYRWIRSGKIRSRQIGGKNSPHRIVKKELDAVQDKIA